MLPSTLATQAAMSSPLTSRPSGGGRVGTFSRPVLLLAGVLLVTRVLAVTLIAADKAESATVKKPADKASSAERDAQSRRLIVGVWQDDYQGKRTMTLKDDGTGTMVVELSGLQATLFASRLEFDLAWSVENGRFKERTTGGKPYLRVQAILKTMGDRVDQPILELTDDRLLLLDKDGKTKYDWRRVRETAE